MPRNAKCSCFYERSGTVIPQDWAMTISIHEVREIVAGRVRGARIEDPRQERIVVMGSFLHLESSGQVFRLDHWDSDRELIHCVWPD
ncbi:hypothetical protein SEA_GETALONG_52 [Gordonia phage Getalong]|uniref:Uncharacterized protein n=3 Tax=Getalongvirus TaxID=2733156 RepID=A0A3S9UPV5_9CAUD|nr:hypothetical protein HOU38_gp052 [Gordonia phage Getalong]YP_009818664.1 hypothetical protein HOU97_gp48 [Gordonia phage Kenna]AYD83912.1 hypothetical protein SEA_GETALONG_52 [Gordonia phage Getalong]AZS12325.1 hypothetical protein SEA_KENNA_48 [Gordonia phage Kenna]QCG77206.1 hypothetical protein SEA_LUTUM_49 [Gordonia phage Lutum]